MNDEPVCRLPAALESIRRESERLGFNMASEPRTGSLLQVLAASKPGGRFLELGTGTGIGTAWILSGMDPGATLETVDIDPRAQAVAKQHLGADARVTFHEADGADFLGRQPSRRFDFIYADAWPGKFSHLDAALALLGPGGLYVIDDLLAQQNWPEGHAPKVPALISTLEERPDFVSIKLAWASGLMILARTKL